MNGGGDRSERELKQADRVHDDRGEDSRASTIDLKKEEHQENGDAHKDEKKPGDEGSKPTPTKNRALVPFVFVAIFVLGFVSLVLWLVFKPRPNVWTDDAYVRVYSMAASSTFDQSDACK